MSAKMFLVILLLTMVHFFCMKTPCLIKSTKNMILQEIGTTNFYHFLFHMKSTEARSSKNVFLHFSMFYCS